MAEPTLQEIRKQIDNLDAEIQALITQRAQCAEQVALAKKASLEPEQPIECYRPARETEVLQAVVNRNQGPLKDSEMAVIFQEIMSACRRLQKPLSVAYLGPEGTFTQMAAIKHFGHFIQAISETSIDDVFRSVALGSAEYGVVPIENSVEGSVTHTVDQFIESEVKICGEVQLPIHHCLLSNEKEIKPITKVYAHQQALSQCRLWIQAHLGVAELIPVGSNAEAAVYATKAPQTAAIACEVAAEIYGLNLLEKNIEDDINNTTRFLVIGKKDADPTGNDQTSLLLSTPNKPGSLHALLQPMAKHGISMTRIESRPSRKTNWDYVFFVDIQGHHQNESVAAALTELQQDATFFKVLGSYPCHIH